MQLKLLIKEDGLIFGWKETSSVLVTLAFKSNKIVPWQLRNRWQNCLYLCNSISYFLVTHVFREENHCADKLADIDFSPQTHMWWDSLPGEICIDFARNRYDLPCFLDFANM